MKIIVTLLTIIAIAIAPSCALAVGCVWSTIKTTDSGYLYTKECHHKVGVLIGNESDYKSEITSLRKVVELKDLSIADLRKDSSMWQTEAQNQFQLFDNYKKAEAKRTWLYIGGGAAGALLLVFLVNSASK